MPAISWIIALLGIWLIISPWVLGFSGDMAAVWNAVIVGIIVLILGAYNALTTAGGAPRRL